MFLSFMSVTKSVKQERRDYYREEKPEPNPPPYEPGPGQGSLFSPKMKEELRTYLQIHDVYSLSMLSGGGCSVRSPTSEDHS